MPAVIVRGCDVCPSSTSECPKETNEGDEFGQGGVLPSGQTVPKAYENETWPRRKGDKELED